MSDSFSFSKKQYLLVIVGILFFILSVYSARVQSFWLDEAITARVVYQHNFFDLITKFSVNDFHPPLYYIFEKLWISFLPYNQVFLRLSSSILIFASFWLLAKSINLWAGLFFLFNPLTFFYAVEARMYALIVFLFSLIFVKFYKEKFDLYYYLAVFLSFLVFYGSVFYILAIIVALLLKTKVRVGLYTFAVFLISVVLVSPLLYAQLLNSSLLLSSVPNWALVLGTADFKNLALVFIKLVLGRVRPESDAVYYFLVILSALLVYLPVVFRSVFDQRLKDLLWLFFIIVLLGFLFSFLKPVLQYFRFIYLVVILSVMLSFIPNYYYKLVVFIFFCCLTALTVFNKNFYREDWKQLVADLPAKSSVYMISAVSDPVWFYNQYFDKQIKVNDLSVLENLAFDSKENVFVVEYAFEIFGINKAVLDSKAIEFSRAYNGSIILHKLEL
ncbi:MAG: hypothetical protein KatS3mg091_017 [Patescibacteria group bacterium]|nr:MAG: hypothetical protein KatS3mg091_017 [Patescibacteria group bacterium]